MLAHAFDMYGERVTKPQDVSAAISRAIKSGKPAIVDVVTDADESSPRD